MARGFNRNRKTTHYTGDDTWVSLFEPVRNIENKYGLTDTVVGVYFPIQPKAHKRIFIAYSSHTLAVQSMVPKCKYTTGRYNRKI